MRTKLIGVLAAAALLAACQTAPEEAASTAGAGTAAAPPAAPAQPSGVAAAPVTTAPSSATTVTAVPPPEPGTQEDLVVNVGDRVFFDFDRSVIKAEAAKTLERQAAWLKRYPQATVTIEGHTDERGTREYNLALGERRAAAVKNFLVSLGIDPGRISTISYGKERPAAIGHNEAAWAQNRRAVTVVN